MWYTDGVLLLLQIGEVTKIRSDLETLTVTKLFNSYQYDNIQQKHLVRIYLEPY